MEPLEQRHLLAGVVAFNELMYHDVGDTSDEWIELHNKMSVDVDVSNWNLSGGVDFDFPEGTIVPARGYLVVASNPTILAEQNSDAQIVGPFTGRLSNGGDDLLLFNNNGRLLDEIIYNDRNDWPSAPDGSGATLAKLDPQSASDVASHWTFSSQLGGTPGTRNFRLTGFSESVPLVPEFIPAKAIVPSDESLGDAWHEIRFNDSDWLAGTTGIGFDLRDDYNHLLGLNLEEPPNEQTPQPMNGVNQSVFVRIPFEIDNFDDFQELILHMRYEDGFVAYLNGVEVARDNVPDSVDWNSSALVARPDNIATAQVSFNLTDHLNLLQSGTNLLAIHGLNYEFDRRTGDLLMLPELLATREIAPDSLPTLKFNEIAGINDPFFVEMTNSGDLPINLGEFEISSTSNPLHEFALPNQILESGDLIAFNEDTLGFRPVRGEILLVQAKDSLQISDAIRQTDRLTGKTENEVWAYPNIATPGTNNSFTFHDEIVINEIMYQGPVAPSIQPNPQELPLPASESLEEWLELHNRSDNPVSLSGWRLSGGVDYTFDDDATIAANDYLVIAADPNQLRSDHPELSADSILGPYSGRLANDGEQIVLLDSVGNSADEVTYHDRGRWPGYANGGHSSLELIDRDADNSIAESWAASNESARSDWVNISYSGQATNIGNDPREYNEFLFGLLESGEILIDDVSVIENPGTPDARQLIQNSDFSADSLGDSPAKWRIIGNHKSVVTTDPKDPSNRVLHVTTTGPTEHMHNNAGTTLKDGNDFVSINGRSTYQISFRAKWLAGSNQLHTRLYFNRLARKHLLPTAESVGTPGLPNSMRIENAGPTFSKMQHWPAVPNSEQPVTVSVSSTDPDGIDHVTLKYSVNGRSFQSVAMTAMNNRFVGEIPAADDGRVVQFFVEATDLAGATSTFPAKGEDSRALYKVSDGRAANPNSLTVRIIMTPSDASLLHSRTNVMSNDRLRGTLVVNDEQIYHDVQIKLKGAQRIRSNANRVGFNIKLDPENKFRGEYDTIRIDRNGGAGTYEQKEILVKHAIQHAGGIPGMYDDIALVVPPRPGFDINNATTGMLITEAYDGNWMSSSYVNGDEGNAYEYELIYFPTTTSVPNDIESLKLPSPDDTARVDLRLVNGFEQDVEAYRWHFQHDNRRNQDEYDQLMKALGALSLPSGDAYHEATQRLLDVDEWLRTFAMISLFGVGDNYGTGSQHNVIFYFRPSDDRMLFFPWDMDFAFLRPPTGDLVSNADLSKLLTDPNNAHAFYGHVYDILSTTFNNDYMDRWIDHYGDRVTDPFPQNFKNYIATRTRTVTAECGNRSRCLPNRTGFQITTDSPFLAGDARSVEIEGTGWVDVREIRIAGSDAPLQINWTDPVTWHATLPVNADSNEVTLNAFDFQGNIVGTQSIAIESSVKNPVSEFLRITEINYNPSAPTAQELNSLPGLNNDDFEFLELVNHSTTATLDLTNVVFTDGVSFQFPHGLTLAPEDVVLIVANESAFALRYETDAASRIAGSFQNESRLRNSGETLAYQDAFGDIIQSFAYDDNPDAQWPQLADGDGRTLEIVDNTGDYSAAANWRDSQKQNGTPGEYPPKLPGDLNSDGILSSDDIDTLCRGMQNNDDAFDLTGDGNLNEDDIVILVEDFMNSSIGDADLSGHFNSRDFVRVFQVGEYEDNIPNNSDWSEGDWNCDGEFDSGDIVFAFQRGRYELP